MSIYNDNLRMLKSRYPLIYEAVESCVDDGTVVAGDADDGEKYLAVIKGDSICPLNSIYSPKHEVDRYMEQFAVSSEQKYIVMTGFGSGEVIRRIIGQSGQYIKCLVYEPSLAIFCKVMKTYDIQDILKCSSVHLFIQDVNDSEYITVLNESMDYMNWEFWHYICLPKYPELFEEKEEKIYRIYRQERYHRNVDQNTLINRSKIGSDNEIHSFKWLIEGKNIYELSRYITEKDVCIVVAAGPSLEKNVLELRNAQGKAFILSVDSALKTLLKHDIMPDMVCTMDPEKRYVTFNDERISRLPFAITPNSSYKLLNTVDNLSVMYYSAGNSFYKQLFEKYGCEMPYFYGGGSVATNCFKIALELGFHTVILVGQDLAIQDGKVHADGSDHEEVRWEKIEVDGYYGGKVVTLTDYKLYLDWYADQIPAYTDRLVINATEGGAGITGAEAMPLAGAIRDYCLKSFEFDKIYQQISPIWNTVELKQSLYQDLISTRDYLNGLHMQIKALLPKIDNCVKQTVVKTLTMDEAKTINNKIQMVMNEITDGDAATLLYRRMIEEELDFQHKIQESSNNRQLIIKDYLINVDNNIVDMLQHWNCVLEEIRLKYKFDQ